MEYTSYFRTLSAFPHNSNIHVTVATEADIKQMHKKVLHSKTKALAKRVST